MGCPLLILSLKTRRHIYVYRSIYIYTQSSTATRDPVTYTHKRHITGGRTYHVQASERKNRANDPCPCYACNEEGACLYHRRTWVGTTPPCLARSTTTMHSSNITRGFSRRRRQGRCRPIILYDIIIISSGRAVSPRGRSGSGGPL